jgi:hypothetical protein
MSTIACPVCAGPVELSGDHLRCLVGHDFEPEVLQEAAQKAAARALWMAVRALEDATSTARWIMDRPEMSERKPYLGETITSGDKAAGLLRALISGREGDDSQTETRPERW